MRILFISGVARGGSPRSTRELAKRLAARGHSVGALFGVDEAPRRRAFHKRTVNLEVKLGPSPLARVPATVAGWVCHRPRPVDDGDVGNDAGAVRTWESPIPSSAFPAVERRFRPDVVVAASIDRMDWRRIRARLRAHGTPSVLYVREQNAFGHLTVSDAPPDRLVTNAAVHTQHAAELGYDAVTVPSVVSVDACLVESTRERILVVNPTPLYGLDVALALAAARPDLGFTLAESSALTDDDVDALRTRLAALPNVELRRFSPDPRTLYRDACVLLAPYRTNGRPRVVLEAQANGIPVLASDLPALREAVGHGGLVVDADAPVAVWVDALSRLVDDRAAYGRFVEAAREHSRREEVDPEAITDRFERVLSDLVATGGRATGEPGRARWT
jgi:glycosyltransferase involved in cell wall biosynthesis